MISAIVLAAGRATRLGRPKQLLTFGGEPLVRRAARTALAAGLDEVVVVLGHAADEARATLEGLPVKIVVNPRFAEGQSTSLRAGLEALAPDSEAVVVLLADQPLVEPELVAALVDLYRDTGAPLALPVYHVQRGNPVLFSRALYPELLEVQGDRGARQVVERHLLEAALLQLDDARSQQDVDTWEQYQALKRFEEPPDG